MLRYVPVAEMLDGSSIAVRNRTTLYQDFGERFGWIGLLLLDRAFKDLLVDNTVDQNQSPEQQVTTRFRRG
jgi:hypothetical protein